LIAAQSMNAMLAAVFRICESGRKAVTTVFFSFFGTSHRKGVTTTIDPSVTSQETCERFREDKFSFYSLNERETFDAA